MLNQWYYQGIDSTKGYLVVKTDVKHCTPLTINQLVELRDLLNRIIKDSALHNVKSESPVEYYLKVVNI